MRYRLITRSEAFMVGTECYIRVINALGKLTFAQGIIYDIKANKVIFRFKRFGYNLALKPSEALEVLYMWDEYEN
jgi:hypothetical protein